MAPASNVDCKQAEKTTSRGPVCEHSVNSNSHNNNIGNHVSVPPVSHSHPRKKKKTQSRDTEIKLRERLETKWQNTKYLR